MGHMTYQAGMEQIPSDMMEHVLCAREAYDPASYKREDVLRALSARGVRTPADFAALLSPAARQSLEELARAAQNETRARFGNSVYLFTPLYMANYCENHCVYCGFNQKSDIRRAKLGPADIERELKEIAATGLEEILLLTGESPQISDINYLKEACRIARRYFRVVGLEVYPVNVADYAALQNCGADFITVFQETYDPEVYRKMHPGGRKAVFPYRFYAQERAILGGMRGVGFAALLGLADFRRDAYATGLHAFLLQQKYPQAEIALSCPRMRPTQNSGLKAPVKVDEADLLQIVCAYRLFLPFANITISSRENAGFRDHIVQIAATKISAGVDVGIGGHTDSKREAKGDEQSGQDEQSRGGEQFEIDDGRSVSEIYNMLLREGMQPVMSEYIDT